MSMWIEPACSPPVREPLARADGVALELLTLGLVTFDIRQARDVVTLQAAMQRRPCRVRDRGLESKEAVIQRQQRVPSEGNDHRLLGLGQNRRARFPRSGLHLYRRTLAPLRHRFGVDTQLPAQLRERSLRSLYCCSDGVRGRGAAMTNLSQSASFHSQERIAPSNRGIKQLAYWFPLTMPSGLILKLDGQSDRSCRAAEHALAPPRPSSSAAVSLLSHER